MQQDLLRRRLDRVDRQAGSDIALEQWKKQQQWSQANVPALTESELFQQKMAKQRFAEQQDMNAARREMGQDQQALAQDKFERVKTGDRSEAKQKAADKLQEGVSQIRRTRSFRPSS